jgi:spermidine synthase
VIPRRRRSAILGGVSALEGRAEGRAAATRRVRAGRWLEVLVLAVGMASLGTEIAAARLMAPFFGASTLIWANTIAVVLVALSVGYRVGGRMATRRPDGAALSSTVLVAAVLLALVPLVAHPFLRLSVRAFDTLSLGAFAASLFGVLALVAVPVLLLGTVSPWALRLRVTSVERAGGDAGRLYAISTLGSLAGTFLAALVLIPHVGTQRTFLAFAGLVALAALPGAGVRWAPVPALIAAALALPVGTVKPAEEGRVLAEAETPYQYARVVQQPDGVRRLELNEGQAIHSLWRPGTVLTRDYWDGFLAEPFLALSRPPSRIAVLGTAGGTVPRAYGRYFPRTQVDAVDIDARLFALGRRYLGLTPRPGLREIAQDARPFLRRTRARYDAIFVDAYRQPYIPFYLTTKEFFALVRARLHPGGIVVVNVGHPEGSDALERVLSATMGAVFRHVARDPIEPTNTLLCAGNGRLDRAGLIAAASRVPADVAALALAAAQRVAPPLPGGDVYTDDRAPVEWLVDASIVRYAAGEGER